MQKRVNIKLVAIFIVVVWLFEKSGQTFGYFRNINLAEAIRNSNGNIYNLKTVVTTPVEVTDLAIASSLTSLLFAILAIICISFISRKKHWHWLNVVIAGTMVFIIGWTGIIEKTNVDRLLRIPGYPFNGIWFYVINGLVPLAIAIFLLYFSINTKPNSNTFNGSLQSNSA